MLTQTYQQRHCTVRFHSCM